jgi:hypothetical protein
MRQLNTIEYQQIAGGAMSRKLQSNLDICIKTPTLNSAEEQLSACQKVIDHFEDQLTSTGSMIAELVKTNGFLYERINSLTNQMHMNYSYYDDEKLGDYF